MPQQQQQRVCTPMVVVAFVIGCQVAVMVMHAGRHDAHVAREEAVASHDSRRRVPRRARAAAGDAGAQDTRSGARAAERRAGRRSAEQRSHRS